MCGKNVKAMNIRYILVVLGVALAGVCQAQVRQNVEQGDVTDVGHKEYYALVDSAEICVKSGDFEGAEEFVKRALKLEPANVSNSLLMNNMATFQRYQGKYEKALQTYNAAIKMTPNAVTLIKNRASLYLEMDSLDSALKDYERIMNLDAGELEARYYHAMIAMQREDVDVAKEDVDALMTIAPKSKLAQEAKAKFSRRWGDVRIALKIYSDQIDKAKKPTSLMYSNRAECYLQLKLLNEAANDIRKAIELDPKDGYLYLLRAKLNKLWYNETDKRADITKAVELGLDREYAERMVDGPKKEQQK